jgi:hypothetical protein
MKLEDAGRMGCWRSASVKLILRLLRAKHFNVRALSNIRVRLNFRFDSRIPFAG